MAISSARRRPGPDCRGTIADAPRLRRRAWETRFGCWAAVSLTVLEVKRLLLLALEMLVDSRAIRFAGALLPVAFTFVDAGLGFPVAVAAVYAIRKHKVRPCHPKIKRHLRRVVLTLTVCAILNIVTVVLIGFYVNSNANSLRNVFRASMRFYAKNVSYKITIDELQLNLQCCGFSSYMDWFAFDWQVSEYAESVDSEEYGDRSVPFSCCSRRTLLPCAHAEMQKSDARTVNARGCAAIISGILFKVAVVGYTMTSLIVCTQLIMMIFLIRIIRRVLPEICPGDCSCWESTCPLNATVMRYSSDDCPSHCPENHKRSRATKQPSRTEILVRPRKVCRRPRAVGRFCGGGASSRCTSSCNSNSSGSCSSDSGNSAASSSSCARLTSSPSLCGGPAAVAGSRRAETASIDPSAQQQHQLPQRRK